MSHVHKTKPFLRWAGGKQWLIPRLADLLPSEFNNYHEPFLGGGSLFIHLKENEKIKGEAFLSDLNEELINAYIAIKDDPEYLIDQLNKYTNTEEEYYRVRGQKPVDKYSKAARFIYLNRTSFNGIHRVNKSGEYNVPYGYKSYSELFDFENIRRLSIYLKSTQLKSMDFFESLVNIQKDDLVFLDPPYTVAHENNGFVKYNQKIFEWKDQERLKEFIEIVHDSGAYVILTNAAHKSIDDLYKSYEKKINVSRYSVVGGVNAKRNKYNETIFVI